MSAPQLGKVGLWSMELRFGDKGEAAEAAAKPLGRLEEALTKERDNEGPYFNGEKLSIVDAAYAPAFHRQLLVEGRAGIDFLRRHPKVKAWAEAMLERPSVTRAAPAGFADRYTEYLVDKGVHLASLIS